MNMRVSKAEREASPRSNGKLTLDVMSTSLEVNHVPTNPLGVGCGGPLSWLETLAELCVFRGCVSVEDQVNWTWLQLRA